MATPWGSLSSCRPSERWHGYYGNGIAATGQKVISTVVAVANGSIVDIIKAIKDAKDGIPDMLKKVPAAAAG